MNGIYLNIIDAHDNHALKADQVRDTIILYSLFSGRLMVSDSTLNNNPNLRVLISQNEEYTGDLIQRDLLELIRTGTITPVVREGFNGFVNLREQQAKHPTPNLPSEDYCRLLDNSAHKFLEFKMDAVSSLFKKKLLRLNEYTIDVEAINEVLDYVNKQRMPLYAEILSIIRNRAGNGMLLNDRCDALQKIISNFYIYNIPESLNLLYCQKSAEIGSLVMPKIEIPEPLEYGLYNVDSFFIFHPEVIRAIPADVIRDIQKLPSFLNVSNSLTKGIFNKDEFVSFYDSLGTYFTELENLLKLVIPSDIISKTYKTEDRYISIEWLKGDSQTVITLCGKSIDGRPSRQTLSTARLNTVSLNQKLLHKINEMLLKSD